MPEDFFGHLVEIYIKTWDTLYLKRIYLEQVQRDTTPSHTPGLHKKQITWK